MNVDYVCEDEHSQKTHRWKALEAYGVMLLFARVFQPANRAKSGAQARARVNSL